MTDSSYILIVDDDSDIRDLLGKFLRRHGFETSFGEGWERNASDSAQASRGSRYS